MLYNSEYRHAVTSFVLLKEMPRCSSKHVSRSLARGGRRGVGTLPANWPASSHLPCSVNIHIPILLVPVAADSS